MEGDGATSNADGVVKMGGRTSKSEPKQQSINEVSDPTMPLRLKASRFPGVDAGTSCTQTSYKVRGKAFLFIGEQGGRYKAMFKLATSMEEASKLAQRHPRDFQVGSGIWVTARFSAEEPLPEKRWVKWLTESYELSNR